MSYLRYRDKSFHKIIAFNEKELDNLEIDIIHLINSDGLNYFQESIQLLNLDQFPNLKVFSSNLNQFTHLPDLRNHKNIQKLFSTFGKLISIGGFSNNLSVINISNNNITCLPSFSECHRLKNLDCSFNKITGILDVSKSPIEELDCSNNQIMELKIESKFIRNFKCFRNKLTALPDLTKAIKLFDLDAHNNNINLMPNLSNCKSIMMINMSNNYLFDLPKFPLRIAQFPIFSHRESLIINFNKNYFDVFLKFIRRSNSNPRKIILNIYHWGTFAKIKIIRWWKKVVATKIIKKTYQYSITQEIVSFLVK